MFSATLEAFGAVRTLSAQTQHAKSEEGRRTSEPLDSLIGGVLANQRDVLEDRNTGCALVLYTVQSFPVVMLCCPSTRLVVKAVQDELIVFVW